DTGGIDTGGADVFIPQDIPVVGDATRPTDTGIADVTTSTDGSSCTGSLTVTATAPASGGAIETCTRGGLQVFYDFTATTTGTGVSSVSFNWRNPDGNLVAPVLVDTSGPPFVAHRQV